jgi:hypothetical protein
MAVQIWGIMHLTYRDPLAHTGVVSTVPRAVEAGAPVVTSKMLDAGMAVVWVTDITHPRENELREMLREAFVVMSQIRD